MNNKKAIPNPLTKWRSPLLWLLINLLFWEGLSGFVLFFFGSFIESVMLSRMHWIAGFLSLLPYAFYQWNHYLQVRNHKGQFHYRLGLFSFLTFCLVTVSGVPLLADLDEPAFTIIDLAHTVLSFAFLILLTGHLVLVARITLAKSNKKAPDKTGALQFIWKLVFWIPLTGSLLLLLSVIVYGVLKYN